jgi:hypothetical protein
MQLFVESGRTTFERDTTEVFQIAHDVGYGSPTGLTDTVLIPTGMVAEPVNSAGWSCPGGTGEITCTHPSAIPAGVSVLSVRVYIEPTAEAGMTIVAAVAQSGDKQLQNQAIQLYTVSAGPTPTLQVKRATSSMLPLAVTTDELAEQWDAEASEWRPAQWLAAWKESLIPAAPGGGGVSSELLSPW